MRELETLIQIAVKRQCELVGIPRSSAYDAPVGESAENQALMRLIDELYTLHPFDGVGQMTRRTRQLKHRVNPKRVRRLVRLKGREALALKPNLSKPAPGHEILCVSASRARDRRSQSGLVHGHHLRADQRRVRLLVRVTGLAEPKSVGLEPVQLARLWHTVKYEEIYRRKYDSMSHQRQCLKDSFAFYNHRRPHSAHGELSPAAFHAVHLPAEGYAS